ncbi:MAG: hypothetical protein SFT90_07425, partial [Rickettsiales bacterium]|nr:hypothetical protein [Rickettsiales bacterium]
GWPIVGDSLYGTNSQHPADLLDSNKNQNNNKIENKPKLDNNRPKLLLHAYNIKIPLYMNKEPISITAPLPSYFGVDYK